MILLDCNNYKYLPITLKPLYLNFVNIELLSKKNNRDLAFSQVLDKYSLDEIKEAFRETYIDNNYLISQPQTNSDLILRILEYGSRNIKASHFISNVKNRFEYIYSKGE